MKEIKEAAIDLLTFKPCTAFHRLIEIALGIFAWFLLFLIFLNVFKFYNN